MKLIKLGELVKVNNILKGVGENEGADKNRRIVRIVKTIKIIKTVKTVKIVKIVKTVKMIKMIKIVKTVGLTCDQTPSHRS